MSSRTKPHLDRLSPLPWHGIAGGGLNDPGGIILDGNGHCIGTMEEDDAKEVARIVNHYTELVGKLQDVLEGAKIPEDEPMELCRNCVHKPQCKHNQALVQANQADQAKPE